MTKHSTPRPALFERPETYLLVAALVSGLLVGSIPAPFGITLLLAVLVALPLSILALIPGPGERAVYSARRRRRAAR